MGDFAGASKPAGSGVATSAAGVLRRKAMSPAGSISRSVARRRRGGAGEKRATNSKMCLLGGEIVCIPHWQERHRSPVLLAGAGSRDAPSENDVTLQSFSTPDDVLATASGTPTSSAGSLEEVELITSIRESKKSRSSENAEGRV